VEAPLLPTAPTAAASRSGSGSGSSSGSGHHQSQQPDQLRGAVAIRRHGRSHNDLRLHGTSGELRCGGCVAVRPERDQLSGRNSANGPGLADQRLWTANKPGEHRHMADPLPTALGQSCPSVNSAPVPLLFVFQPADQCATAFQHSPTTPPSRSYARRYQQQLQLHGPIGGAQRFDVGHRGTANGPAGDRAG
jgi:hypothetical protein